MTHLAQGNNGELVGYLVDAMNAEGDWRDLGVYLLVAVGGVGRVEPASDQLPVPGSVGEHLQRTSRVVSRVQYFDIIRARLLELVADGVYEVFLVRSLRDFITRELEHLADTGAGDRRRAKHREQIEREASDPAFVAKFRQRLLDDGDPTGVAELSDAEVANRVRAMAAKLEPSTLENEAARWASLDAWRARLARYLSDEAIEDWGRRNMLRQI